MEKVVKVCSMSLCSHSHPSHSYLLCCVLYPTSTRLLPSSFWLLLCAETEKACSRASEDFLNFLADCGYKAREDKYKHAHLCLQACRWCIAAVLGRGSICAASQLSDSNIAPAGLECR